jgi:hypothetical protein
LGRRIYKSSSTTTSIFAYDGANLVVEETNSSSAAVTRYLQGLNIDKAGVQTLTAQTNLGAASLTNFLPFPTPWRL